MKTRALKQPILLSGGKTKPITSQNFKCVRLIRGSFFVYHLNFLLVKTRA